MYVLMLWLLRLPPRLALTRLVLPPDTIYMSTALHSLLHDSLSNTMIVLIMSPFLVALCCVPDLKHFIAFSWISNLVSGGLPEGQATRYTLVFAQQPVSGPVISGAARGVLRHHVPLLRAHRGARL
jgi:hypothetical protein